MRIKIKKNNFFIFPFLLLIVGFFIFSFQSCNAGPYDYEQLEPIPGSSATTGADLKTYIESIYKFAIWTVGIAAILMITIGGFMYLTSAGNTSKMDNAKRVVVDATIGLIVVLTAYLVLYVINPDLVKITISLKSLSSGMSGAITNKPVSIETTGGSCGGLSTQAGIASQCGDASSELVKLLGCIKNKQPSAVISSISDSQGYAKCVNGYQRPPCAHAQFSCHYGGKNCRGKGSYGVDLSTRNLSSSQLKAAANECGADYALDEGNHVHASVGKQGGCGCN
jgi:hypothetical protein